MVVDKIASMWELLKGPPLVYDLPLRWRIQSNCLCNQIAQSQFGATALVAPAELQVPMEVEELPRVVAKKGALIPTPPPSSSNAFGVTSLPSASSSKLPVRRSPGGYR